MNKTIKELLEFGIINIDKPTGPTSFWTSQYVKNAIGLRKTSHLGTLDPMVTGVLPVALNRACRLNEYLMHRDKTYVGVIRVHKEISIEDLQKIANEFIGKITQMPPVRSSVKRAERVREIKTFKILEKNGNDFLFSSQVQAGTYIRKLCLHPSTELIASSGLISIKEFYNNPTNIYSMSGRNIITNKPSQLQKINSPKNLIKLTTSSGIDIIMTGDHKMLISSKEGYIFKETDQLKKGEYLVKNKDFQLPEKEYVISDLLDDNYLIEQKEIKEKCKKAMIEKFGSIREMYRKTKLDRKVFLSNSKCAISIKHLKLAGIYDSLKKKINNFKTQKGTIINIKELNEDHLYLLGLIASDGNNTKEKRTERFTRLKFHNKNKDLINIFLNIYTKLFPNVNISKKEIKKDFFELDTANSLFASIAAKLGIFSPHKNSDILPILCFKNNLIKSFLKGYFDGDGTAHYKRKKTSKGNYSEISFFCISYLNSKRIHQMLLKLEIKSKIFRLKNGLCVISISDLNSKMAFIEQISSNHPKKLEVFQKIKQIKNKNLEEAVHIAIHYKEFIRNNKKSLSKMGGNLQRVLNLDTPITKGFYKSCSKLVNLPDLDNFIVERINKIECVNGSDFVYDMTVPKYHNFLIETGFISSNCDDLGKKITGAHMLELRRTQAGIFKEDTAITLYEFDRVVDEYKKGNEEPLRKIIVSGEIVSTLLPVIKIRKDVVKKVLTGSPIFKSFLAEEPDKKIKEGDKVIVYADTQFIGCYNFIGSDELIAKAEFILN